MASSGAMARALQRLALLLALCLTACGVLLVRARRPRVHRPGEPLLEESNVTRRDYAGSESCARCHAALYAQWARSPMHRMTRAQGPELEVRGRFDGSVFRFGSDAVTVSQVGAQRFLRLAQAGQPEAVYRVTRVIGGRYREDYAGVRVEREAASPRVVGDPREELIMPVSWVYSSQSWRYKGYSVMVRERPGMRASPPWRETCIFCHNTVPFLDTVLGELHGPGAPAYQGVQGERLLPPSRRSTLRVTDNDGLYAALDEEFEYLHGDPSMDLADGTQQMLRRTMHAMRRRFDASHLIELGVGCESCHNGSREHAERPQVRPSFEPLTGLFAQDAPAGRDVDARAWAINQVCLRCHTVLFSRYPYTWEGGSRAAAVPGGSHINSGEARDFLLGGCATRMSCASCHDPHTEDSAEALARWEMPAGNTLCTSCHRQYETPEARAAHTHHAPDGVGSACIQCHMPRKNMGLAYNLTRYHQVGSPTEPRRVEHDRPLECALCHADRSVNWLVGAMERFWGRRFDRERLRSLYGANLEVNPLHWTAAHGLPHEVAVAVSVLGRERVRGALPLMASQLNNEYPLVRYFAQRALEQTLGHPLALDMNQPGPELVAQARALLEREGVR